MKRIYLDHAATSPMHPEVMREILPYMSTTFGNPSSIHSFGRESRHAVDESRSILAASIGAKPREIIFTSGGTESVNLAVIGVALANEQKGKHIITTKIEHHAVLHSCLYLEKSGFNVTYLPVNEEGNISIDDLKKGLTNETILVSIMYGNNEVGTIQPIEEIAELLKDHPAYFHTDAVQAYGMEKIDVQQLGIDFMSATAHKINGPKGVGFLYAREGKRINPLIFGGGQELKRRAGTENVAGIVGLGVAAKMALSSRKQRSEQYLSFKEEMLSIFREHDLEFNVNGSLEGLPHVLNIYFKGAHVESLLTNMDLAGIAVSSGSACTAGSIQPSHVLVAMHGEDAMRSMSSIRFSFGRENTLEDVRIAANETANIVTRLAAEKLRK
ncbi:cysteine desulfurase family protein [Bacillus sp. PK3_68]|uniref:cysteine desulfurase family protein n=1 Tax=Bacillus sp. PK3_68 TaxID=2027408 RepID=UPI000E743574|nr:cysteine desulfurase family protein [Bacillus sp. PK3_68]RJS58810.1 cysteine desulfurase NifS [Bacillus sp. PK3_68]